MADEDVKIIIKQKGTIPVYTKTKIGVAEVYHDETLKGSGTTSAPLGISDEVIEEIENAGKVNDVRVDGISVVTDKIAEIDLTGKVDKTSEADKVYGTDAQGNQTIYGIDSFGTIDNIEIHGVTQPNVNKTVDLSVIEQMTTLPAPSSIYDGRVVQYIGDTTATLTHNCFYECTSRIEYTDATRIVKSTSTQLVASANIETFLQSGLSLNTPYLYEKHGAYWDCIDPAGVTILGSRAGLMVGGIVNQNDQVILEVDSEQINEWAKVTVQSDVGVEDVLVNGTSVVTNNVANVTVPTAVSELTNDSNYQSGSQVSNTVSGAINTHNTSNDAHSNLLTPITEDISDIQDQIDNLSGRGRFLALWNCATGLAESNPPESPYSYKTGDYFIVGTVSSADPAVNYKPDGSSYTTGVASTTVETNEVSVNDTYFYDGTVWKLQSDAQKEVSFSALAGSPYDNTNLSNALNSKQDTLTAGTNITIDANNVISSTAYESLFKGKYNTWSDVPTVGAQYPLYIDDGTHTHEPTYTDYMIVVDASTVPGGQVPIVITFRINAYLQQGSVKTNIGGTEYNGYGSFDGKVQVRTDVSTGNYGTQFVVLSEDIEYQGHTYHQGEVFLQIIHNRVVYGQEYTYNAQLSLGYPYKGTWRFSYRGVWAVDNRNGWIGEYPIEQELPIADDQTLGIAKLYTTTGSNTDGSMTQKSITDALNTKADNSALTAHTSNTNNPHEVTKAQVGLGNVDNTSDLNKPISTATQNALNLKANIEDLATVATSGSYTDLSNKPTIPTVGNGTITITQGGITKGTFTTNQSGDTTVALDAGGGGGAVDSVNGKTGVVVLTATDVGALPDSTVIPDAQIQSDWNQADNTKVDFIKNKPTIPTVNNPTITITQGGITKGSFTLNQATGDTIALDAGGVSATYDATTKTITFA